MGKKVFCAATNILLVRLWVDPTQELFSSHVQILGKFSKKDVLIDKSISYLGRTSEITIWGFFLFCNSAIKARSLTSEGCEEIIPKGGGGSIFADAISSRRNEVSDGHFKFIHPRPKMISWFFANFLRISLQRIAKFHKVGPMVST